MSFQVLEAHHKATYAAPACCSSHGEPAFSNTRGKKEMGHSSPDHMLVRSSLKCLVMLQIQSFRFNSS